MKSFDLNHLEEAFTEEEIFEAIKDMPKEKAPRPDGFTNGFLC